MPDPASRVNPAFTTARLWLGHDRHASPMTGLSDSIAAERRARLAAERMLARRQAEMQRSREELSDQAQALTEGIREKRAELARLEAEAAGLKATTERLRRERDHSRHVAAKTDRLLWEALQAMRDGFAVFDADGRMIVANTGFTALFEQLAEVRPGLSYARLAELLAGEGLVDTGAAGADWPAALIARHARDPIPDTVLSMWNGRQLRLSERRLPDGGLVSLCIDMTAFIRVETAIDAMPDGFCLFDADDRLVTANPRFRALRGADDTPPETPETADADWLARLRATAPGDDPEVMAPCGTWLRLHETATPDGGRAAMLIDVTAMKAQQAELVVAREAAEAASRAKSTFLANMSHEIRTPMNGILAMAGTLSAAELAPDLRDCAAALDGSARALMAVLDDVLDVSALDAGEMALNPAPFDPARLLDEVADMLGPVAAAKGLDLGIDRDIFLPPALVGDAGRIRQILLNLAGNAVKFTETGRVLLRATGRPEDAGPDRFRLHLTVEDTGPGVPPDRTDRLFAAFSQTDESHTRAHDGSGLGLALCKRLVALMGGEIWHRALDPHGACFGIAISLPAICADRPLRVLAAEDNATNRFVLGKMLADDDIELSFAENGAEALAAVQATPPDLVLMDISMPVMDGLETARRIRAWEAETGRPPLRIAALTAHAGSETAADCAAAGIDRHIAKPLSRAALEDELAPLRAARQAACALAKAGAPGSDNSGSCT
ncbi:response regulator [Palleronia sediminis]|uniref:histidine kinase n=1 Tax=Palleronia sediminis TaxID=2547833 RepID=A0A4R6A6F9_9RHOB|nr:PAS-domain containing protein [Palleronia sediminis]TDL78465.1 response regulator [Palleronia sediminis]